MRVAVLRACGQNWNPEIFLREHKLVTAAVWQETEGNAGRRRADSGFNVTIADAASSSELVSKTIRWVQENRAVLAALTTTNVKAQVDIGVTVGSSEQFSASVLLTQNDLLALSQSGVELSFSAYPASDG